MKKTLLITSHFLPVIGGAPVVYDALARRLEGQLAILTEGQPEKGAAQKTAIQKATIQKEASQQEAAEKEAPSFEYAYPLYRWPRLFPDVIKGLSLAGRLKQALAHYFFERALLAHLVSFLTNRPFKAVIIGDLGRLGWLVAPLKQALSLPVLLYVHGEEISEKAHSLRARHRREKALKAADKIIAVSRATADNLQKNYALAAHKIFCLPNGVENNDSPALGRVYLEEQMQLPSKGPLLLAVGRLVARKGFDRLLEAMLLIWQKTPEARLLIVGDGPLRPLVEAAVRAHPEHIFHQTPCSREKLDGLYKTADLFVLPNRRLENGDTEGFGLVFLEAASAGLAAIGGRAGGVVDAIKEGETGLLVDGNDPQTIADAILALLEDAPRRAAMGAAGLLFARAESWDKKAKQFEAFMDSL